MPDSTVNSTPTIDTVAAAKEPEREAELMDASPVAPRERLDSPIERADLTVSDTFIPESVDQLLAHSRRYPLLTPAQEIELAQRIERGDLHAKELLVNSNLRLVASNARRYQNQGLPVADLVQEGMLGLIRASEKFDWRKGFRFSTYATLWIRQAIQRGLENSGRTIRLPVHVAQRSRKVGRVERELSVRLGREPTISELAQETGLTIEQVEEVRHQRAALVSLDPQVGEDGDTALRHLLSSDVPPRNLAKSGFRFSSKACTPSRASADAANSCRPLNASAAWPARCSLSWLNDCFKKRSAVGERARISSAQRRTAARSSAPGTTRLTNPQRSASCASYRRHRNQISRARFSPTTRAR